MKILLTGARLPVSREIARALSKVGATVYAADSVSFPYNRFSRSVAHYWKYPSPRHDFAFFAEALKAFVAREKIDLVIPVSEEVFFLSQVLEEKFFGMPFDILLNLHSKQKFLEMAKSAGLLTPASMRATDLASLLSARSGLKQFVVKPEFSRGGFHALFTPTEDALKRVSISPSRPWVLQEFVSGIEICTYSICREGTVGAHTSYEPKYRVGPGASLYFEPVEDPFILETVQRFAKRFHLTGQFGFDFIRTPEGQTYVIECNPRATTGAISSCPVQSGDRPFSKHNTTSLPPTEFPAWPLPPSLAFTVSRPSGKSSSRPKDIFFDWRDPLPALSWPLSMIETWLAARHSKLPLAEAFTHDIEWDGPHAEV